MKEDPGKQFRRLMEHAPVGLVLLSPDGDCVWANHAAADTLGYTVPDLLGQGFRAILSGEDGEAEDELIRELLAGERRTYEIERLCTHRDGRSMWVRRLVAQLTPPARGGPELVCRLQDITAAKQTDLRLREERRLLDETQAVSGIGSWELDLETRQALWSRQQLRIYGLDPDRDDPRASPERFLAMVHPDDRDAVQESMLRHFQLESGSEFDDEFRIRHPQLGTRTLRVHGRLLAACADTEQPRRASGITQDVTEERAAEAARRELEERNRILLSSLPDTVVALYDTDLICVLAQGRLISSLGMEPSDFEGRRVDETLPPDLRKRFMPLMQRALRGEPGTIEHTTARTGRALHVELLPYRLEDGTIAGAFTVTRDITHLRERERQLAEAQALAHVGSWRLDVANGELSSSDELCRVFGYPPGTKPTLDDLRARVHGDDPFDDLEASPGAPDGERIIEEFRLARPDGMVRYVQGRRQSRFDDRGILTHVYGTIQDITERHEAETAVRLAEERFRRTFDSAPIGMALISLDGTIEQANEALARICEQPRAKLVGQPFCELLHPREVERGMGALRSLGSGAIDELAAELRFSTPLRSAVYVSINGTLLRDGADRATHLLLQCSDVTERKRFEEQLQFLADHDPLTGLLNRRRFEAELERHIAHVRRYGAKGALIVLDIDHFKQVNDLLGHSAGDDLIGAIGASLSGRLRSSDTLARLGGDEFAVLLPKASDTEAERVAELILDAVRTTTATIAGTRKRVTASIGVAMFGHSDTCSAESILVAADLAMYDAKDDGRDRYAIYDGSGDGSSRTKMRLTWVGRIEHALEHDRFALVAQPILDLRSGAVHQHELLVRMRDDHDELIPPASFLPIAERYGLISKIDEWVASQAIALIERQPALQLEVNLSAHSLGDPAVLLTIEERLRCSGIDPSRLVFEVTETVAVTNIAQARMFATQLGDLGCRFALDDFGAGFGSFYYLKHLPFDYVKIDGEFIRHVVSGRVDQLVVEAVVRIARGLGKETIAEYVADERTREMVKRLGVDYAQGYHIGKPVPLSEAFEFVSPPPPDEVAAHHRAS